MFKVRCISTTLCCCALLSLIVINVGVVFGATGHNVNNDDVYDINNHNNKYYEQRFAHNFDRIHSFAKHFATTILLPHFDRLINETTTSNVSAICRKALRTMVAHPEREWVALMLDSFGRLIPSGFLSGTITDFGDFEQCISIHGYIDHSLVSESESDGGGGITAQYCLLTIRPPIPPHEVVLNYTGTKYAHTWPASRFGTPTYRFYARLTTALCIPTLCSQSEVEQIFRQLLVPQFELNDVFVDTCQVAIGQQQQHKSWRLDFAQILSIIIISICATIVAVGTVIDYRWRCRSRQLRQQKLQSKQSSSNVKQQQSLSATSTLDLWQCFSLLRNCQTLFSINHYNHNNKQQTELSVIHGMRVLLIMWVIICHTTNFAPLGLYDQPMIAARFAQSFQLARDFLTQFVISGSLSVQAFFVISGLISLHTALRNRENFHRQVPYWKYILLRWWRFAPPLLGMFCYQFLWPMLASGPIAHWNYLRYGHQPCYSRWWSNFLFISNWLPLVDQCGSHTWFLSADFQINLFAYFLIWIYVKDVQLGFRVNLFLFALASIAPTVIHWYYSVPLVHIMEPDMSKLNRAFNMIEFNTYNHFAAFLAGLLVASLLNRSHPLRVSKSLQQTLWWTSITIIIVLPFSTYPFIRMEQIPANILSISYTSIKRFLWIVSISWIIYASSTISSHCLVAKVLSASIFQPLSRLTFCVYLTQSLVVWYYAYQSKVLHHISHYETIFRIGGVTLYSLVFAFILYILFEAPSVGLCKLLLKRLSSSETTSKHRTTTTAIGEIKQTKTTTTTTTSSANDMNNNNNEIEDRNKTVTKKKKDEEISDEEKETLLLDRITGDNKQEQQQ